LRRRRRHRPNLGVVIKYWSDTLRISADPEYPGIINIEVCGDNGRWAIAELGTADVEEVILMLEDARHGAKQLLEASTRLDTLKTPRQLDNE
jgi:hypothetical protein